LLVGFQTVTAQITGSGQGVPFFSGINIISPSNGSTYNVGLLILNVNLTTIGGSNIQVSMNYSLDGTFNNSIPLTIQYPRGNSFILALHIGSANLPALSEGTHTLIVFSKIEVTDATINGIVYSKYIQLNNSTVYFTVNDGNPPIISNLSIENKTYQQNKLLLNFTTDEPSSWIGYSLDQQANVTVTGNMTLTGLSDGSHSLVVYSNDTAGNVGASESVTFTVDTPEPLPTALVTASVVSIAAIIAGLAFYFKKHKR
jgi:hypothetical protein